MNYRSLFIIALISGSGITPLGSEPVQMIRWLSLCQKLQAQQAELREVFDSLPEEAQAQVLEGIAPPERWVRFECMKDWEAFGTQCLAQGKASVERCIYYRVVSRQGFVAVQH